MASDPSDTWSSIVQSHMEKRGGSVPKGQGLGGVQENLHSALSTKGFGSNLEKIWSSKNMDGKFLLGIWVGIEG